MFGFFFLKVTKSHVNDTITKLLYSGHWGRKAATQLFIPKKIIHPFIFNNAYPEEGGRGLPESIPHEHKTRVVSKAEI